MATPQEATIPEVPSNNARTASKGILIIENIRSLESTKPALSLAMNTELIKFEKVDKTTIVMKPKQKMALFLRKLKAGDHKLVPAIKTPATAKLASPLNMKLALINCRGLSAQDR